VSAAPAWLTIAAADIPVGTNCGANQFTNGILAALAPQCAQVDYSQLTGKPTFTSTSTVLQMGNGAGGTSDSPFFSPDANTVRQINTVNGQTFEIYHTSDSNTSPVNYERLSLAWNSGQSNFRIASDKGGTGTARGLDIQGNGIGFLNTGGTRVFIVNTSGNISQYGNVATAGQGAIVIRGATRSAAQTAAVASVATFTPSADASFEVSSNVLVTTATSHTFTVTCAYTDEGNTARTATLSFELLAGGTPVTSITNTNGAVPYMGVPMHIRVKGGTAITIATTGTFTTVTYNVEGVIRQINDQRRKKTQPRERAG
jgi:hypothetical protein